MRPITTPNGEVYCWVAVEDEMLKIKLNFGSAKGMVVHFDAKVIPQLRQILAEAEFLKLVN